jgi:cold shock CspA family protein
MVRPATPIRTLARRRLDASIHRIIVVERGEPSHRHRLRARDKNLDSSALSYVQLTLNCVDCHKHVRTVQITRSTFGAAIQDGRACQPASPCSLGSLLAHLFGKCDFLNRSYRAWRGNRGYARTEPARRLRDIQVALRDAFDSACRQLEDYVRRRRGSVKALETAPHARVSKLFPREGYGFLSTPDGREIYFHRHGVLHGAFDRLEVGTEVSFVEAAGKQGPQASTVKLVGRHGHL